MNKKVFLLVFMLSFVLGLCRSAFAEPLHILTSNFPAYDFARTIAGDEAQVEMLLPAGSESHHFEPTPKDIIAIQSADLFIYTGGESDAWIESLLASLDQNAPQFLRMADCVTMLPEEHTDSMEHHHVHTDPDHQHHEEMDEHVWTSPRNVMLIARNLCEQLCLLQPQNQTLFEQNLNIYLSRLEELDELFRQIVSEGKRDIIIFGDRFPMRYFAAEYHLRYDAAFPGCSEDSEPSVRTVISLVDKVREEHIPVVFYIEFSSRKTADILAEETGAKPLLFHSCHNISAEDLASGVTYLSLMHQNAERLKEALT